MSRRDNQSRRQAKKIELSWNLHSRSYSVIEIAQDSQVNMSLSILKILKSIIFNLSTKNIKFFTESFLFLGSFFFTGVFFFERGHIFCTGAIFLRSTVSGAKKVCSTSLQIGRLLERQLLIKLGILLKESKRRKRLN